MQHDDESTSVRTRGRRKRRNRRGGLLAVGATAVVAAVAGIYIFGGAGDSIELVDTAGAVPTKAVAGGAVRHPTPAAAPSLARPTTKRGKRRPTEHKPNPIKTGVKSSTATPTRVAETSRPETTAPIDTSRLVMPEPEVTATPRNPQPDPTTGWPQPHPTTTTGRPRPEPTTTGKPQPGPTTTKPGPTTTKPRPTTTGQPQSGDASQYVQQILTLTNAERAKVGCGPLRMESQLQAAAQAHADDMAARDYYSHTSLDGRSPGDRITATGYGWRGWGENIYRSPKSPEEAMRGWMDSSGHRANILNCSYKDIGVGVNLSANGPWWVQDFGIPS
ncbi:CAP domain-containing protein [Nonomuraea sediminis]|uniref:CAP domain-containing protein n=1 Tax=Nonomuraea sediminis TaxID=2835864 RepID=UPI001BDC3157|nr:CAP domain-containing protein [Nonomuraea sediminis]